jgi:endoglucanase
MKNIQLLFLLVISLSLNINYIHSQPVKKHGQLSVSGLFLVDKNENPVVLNGVSYGWHNWWPRFYNEETVKWLSEDWNCSVVRAAMGVEPKKGYIESPEWSKKKMNAVINGAIKNDVYVIVDWHSHSIKLEAAKEFFTEIAKKYGKYPNIIYQIYNEPVDDSWDEVKAYSIDVIKTIRKYDPNNIILVGSPHWNQDVHIVADDPIVGYENIMYSLHFYADTHKQELRDRGDYAIKKGIPLFVSESGSMASNGDGPINHAEMDLWMEWMKKNKISWISWSIADKDESCSMLKKKASSKGKWEQSDLKESGIIIRELLRQM